MTYEELLFDLISNDERFVVLTAENRAAIRNLPEKIKDRFIDVGIAEQTMIGMAAGLAKQGRIPICHALSTFLTMRAFEFIRTDVGIPGYPVKLIGAIPGFLSEANGPTHQAVEDISLMRGIPNLNVFCPSDNVDMLDGLKKVLYDKNPWYVRFNNQEAPVKHNNKFEIGKAEIILEGNDITIITFGTLLNQAIKAADLLSLKGISTRVINLRTLKPIDEELILSASRSSELVITLEDHFLTGGLYSILSEILLKNKTIANVFPFALQDKWFKPSLLKNVLSYEKFDGESLAEKIFNKSEEIKHQHTGVFF